jgi:hypothetical protein
MFKIGEISSNKNKNSKLRNLRKSNLQSIKNKRIKKRLRIPIQATMMKKTLTVLRKNTMKLSTEIHIILQ